MRSCDVLGKSFIREGKKTSTASQSASQVLQSFFAKIGGQVGYMLGIFPQTATVKAHGKLLHCRLRQHFQNVSEARDCLPRAQSLIDKFRNAFFDAHLRTQAAANAGTLRFDAGN
jgi:hypothetical protein